MISFFLHLLQLSSPCGFSLFPSVPFPKCVLVKTSKENQLVFFIYFFLDVWQDLIQRFIILILGLIFISYRWRRCRDIFNLSTSFPFPVLKNKTTWNSFLQLLNSPLQSVLCSLRLGSVSGYYHSSHSR